MQNKNFTVLLESDQSPEQVFEVVRNVREWWSGIYSEEIEGSTQNINDEFIFRAGEGLHYSKQKLVEAIPGKKIVWLVTDSQLDFLKDKSEWTGTKIIFEISAKGNKTLVRFTHEGLVPEIECYDACSNAWNQYIQEKLLRLITTSNEKASAKKIQSA